MNQTRAVALVVALQALFLAGWAGYHEWRQGGGAVLLLEAKGWPKRDRVQGEYLLLEPRIGIAPFPPQAVGEERTGYGNVWVTLRPAGRFHEIAATSWKRPATIPANSVLVLGRAIESVGPREMLVEYDIEKYFVSEGGAGRDVAACAVEVAVRDGHKLGIKRVLIGGKPVR